MRPKLPCGSDIRFDLPIGARLLHAIPERKDIRDICPTRKVSE